MVSVTDPYDRTHGFLDRRHYLFFQVAPHSHSRDSVDPVPDQLLLKNMVAPGNEPGPLDLLAGTRQEATEAVQHLMHERHLPDG
jgi:hypothetical protein